MVVVFHHKQLGKMAEPKWQSVEGEYIYCASGELLLNLLWLKPAAIIQQILSFRVEVCSPILIY